MKPYDPDDAADLSGRLQQLIASLPPDTNPHTIMTALCALVGRGISLLDPQHQEPALAWVMETIRAGMLRSN